MNLMKWATVVASVARFNLIQGYQGYKGHFESGTPLGILETLFAQGHVSDPRGRLRGPQRLQAPPPSRPA
jgi:hypothetical protein